MQLFAVVETTISGELTISGAYENRRRARTLDGTNHLRQWFDSNGLVPGSTVLLDVVTAGYAYGLREPGTRVVYEASDPPDSSLTDIAESLGE